MADGVIVYTRFGSKKYPGAGFVNINEGSVMLTTVEYGGDLIAAYAPGKWTRIEPYTNKAVV